MPEVVFEVLPAVLQHVVLRILLGYPLVRHPAVLIADLFSAPRTDLKAQVIDLKRVYTIPQRYSVYPYVLVC